MTDTDKIRNTAQRLQEQLLARLDKEVTAAPVTEYVQHLSEVPECGPYQTRSAPIDALLAVLDAEFPDSIETYHAAVLTVAIIAALDKLPSLALTDEIETLSLNNMARILALIEQQDISYMRLGNDQFEKDLSAVSLRLLCAGAQKIHQEHLPNYTVKRHPLTWLKLVSRCGYRGILYEMHTDSNDPFLMSEFSEEGWTQFYRRVAALLRNNSVQGVSGSSWFFDPMLAAVSPRLAYLRNIVMDNGGISINVGSDPASIESATRTSPTRRSLYEKGEYKPTAYTLVWPRRELMAWAGV